MKRVAGLLPLLAVYTFLVLVYAHGTADLRVDENRYAADARDIRDGDYPPGPPRTIWNGPGYPIFLVPFIALKVPWVVARLANAVLLFLALVYLYRLVATYVGGRWGYIAVYCVGLWPVLLEYMPRLMTEPLSMFLACGFAFHFSKAYTGTRCRLMNTVIAAMFLGYLALTKVLFGYVTAVCILVFAAGVIATRRRAAVRALVIYGLAMVLCLPYLAITYSHTGRVFFWSNSGGLSLYWMSNPEEGEYGDWLAGTRPWLKRRKAGKHIEFLDSLKGLDHVEKDTELRRKALDNIKEHPGKFARNWVANLGRLFGEYPFSYESPKPMTYVKLAFGVPLLVLSVLSLIPAFAKRRRIPFQVGALFLVGLTYVGGSSLLSAYNRMLLPVLPLVAFWLCFVAGDLIGGVRRSK
jgi:hypothetical protein